MESNPRDLIAPCRTTQHRRASDNDAHQLGLPPRAGLGQNVFHMRARGCFRNLCVTGENQRIIKGVIKGARFGLISVRVSSHAIVIAPRDMKNLLHSRRMPSAAKNRATTSSLRVRVIAGSAFSNSLP